MKFYFVEAHVSDYCQFVVPTAAPSSAPMVGAGDVSAEDEDKEEEEVERTFGESGAAELIVRSLMRNGLPLPE